MLLRSHFRPALLDLITRLLTGQTFFFFFFFGGSGEANGKFDNGARLFWSPLSQLSSTLLVALC